MKIDNSWEGRKKTRDRDIALLYFTWRNYIYTTMDLGKKFNLSSTRVSRILQIYLKYYFLAFKKTDVVKGSLRHHKDIILPNPKLNSEFKDYIASLVDADKNSDDNKCWPKNAKRNIDIIENYFFSLYPPTTADLAREHEITPSAIREVLKQFLHMGFDKWPVNLYENHTEISSLKYHTPSRLRLKILQDGTLKNNMMNYVSFLRGVYAKSV